LIEAELGDRLLFDSGAPGTGVFSLSAEAHTGEGGFDCRSPYGRRWI